MRARGVVDDVRNNIRKRLSETGARSSFQQRQVRVERVIHRDRDVGLTPLFLYIHNRSGKRVHRNNELFKCMGNNLLQLEVKQAVVDGNNLPRVQVE